MVARAVRSSFVARSPSFVASRFAPAVPVPILALLLYIIKLEEDMWRRLIDWYDDLEREQLAVLENPALAANVRPGWRRYVVDRLAAMTPLERQQLHGFCATYRGRRLWLALGKMAAGFTLLGILLHLTKDKGSWAGSIVVANLIGFSLFAAAISAWFDARRILATKGRMLLILAGSALVGGLAASLGAVLSDTRTVAETIERLPRLLAMAFVGGVTVFGPMLVLSAFRQRQHEALAAKLQRDAETERLAREVSESQLRMLRAQIEPHFLFNTLGAVQQLAADGAPRAAALTEDLIAFLRASFSDMRRDQVTLANEFATIAAYLRVMQARMGARLDFSLDLPDALAPLQVPSMLVLTLVENAIKHGIEPALRGGAILVGAMEDNGRAVIRVRDTGVGMSAAFASGAGDGAGLDNVRRRLALAYGDGASLALHEAEPGVAAELVVPMAAPASAETAQAARADARVAA